MALRLDYIDHQVQKAMVLARKMDVVRTSGFLVLPGKAWKTPAGEGANYSFEGPSIQVRARLFARGNNGQAFQMYTDPKGNRGVGWIRLLSEASRSVRQLEEDLQRRITEKDPTFSGLVWNGIEDDGRMNLEILYEGTRPYVQVPEELLANIPSEGILVDALVGLHRICVNKSRSNARPVWVLLGVRPHTE